jgi:tetratricopeptide (TPR) repeat protein
VAQSAYREAADSFERALAALQHLPETREAIEQGIDLRFALRSELQPLGEHEQVLEHLRQAESLAVALGDQDRLGWASAYLSQYAWVMGDSARAEELGQRAVAIASTEDDFPLRVAADHVLGQGYCLVGDYQRSIEHCRRNVTALQGERVSQRSGFTGLPSVLSRFYLGACLSQLGKFAEACSYGMEAIEIAEAAGQPYDVTLACDASGSPLLARGSLGDAIPFLERGVETCRTWNVRLHLPGALTTLGSAYILAGRLSEALPLLEEGASQASATVWFTSLPIMINLATGYLAVRRMDEATELAARAVTLATERKSRGNLARALRLLGEINLQRDPIEASQAEGFYRQALTISSELGMRPLVAHCHLGLGKLHRRTGNPQEAQEHFLTATTMYREMDMRFWLEQAEAETREMK